MAARVKLTGADEQDSTFPSGHELSGIIQDVSAKYLIISVLWVSSRYRIAVFMIC